MPRRAELDYYASQSPLTDPGELAAVQADAGSHIAGLRRAAGGLVIHYRADDPLAAGVPPQRLAEIDTRYADAMLSRLLELRSGPIAELRAPGERIVGCCRDFTVLFLSMARARRIPARARVGFASYFVAGLWIDHEVAELWDGAEQRWRLIDAQLDDHHLDPTDGVSFDALDVPRERFLVAGEAWQRCRSGRADPETFMVGPDVEIEVTRGWPYLRHNLVHDLAALNKLEMLLWDYWGLAAARSTTDADLELLDRVAAATATPDSDLEELNRLYDQPLLRVPTTVTSYNPLTGEPREVLLR